MKCSGRLLGHLSEFKARKILDRVNQDMTDIIPVLLAGGSGTRLWPLSRKSYPKQFSSLIGDQSLFQQSALRLTSSETVAFAPHMTMTNSEFRFIVGEQLHSVGLQPGPIQCRSSARANFDRA